MDRRDFLIGLAGAGAAAGALPLVPAARAAAGADPAFDIEILTRALALHPGLYRYNTPRAIETRVAALKGAYLKAPDRAARYLLLSRFLATVRCGHTHCNPYNQTDAVVSELYDRKTRLPFRFAWIKGEMIVLGEDDGDGRLTPGARITRLNGERPARLLKSLLPYARTDGHNEGKRVAQLEMRNTDSFETFDIFQGLVAPPKGAAHLIDYQTPDGAQARGEFAALTFAERRAKRRTIETDGASEPFWTWEMKDGVAILTMPSWVMYNSTWDWQSWLRERLDSLAGARGLVIDLRDNEGGNECGNVILSRLAARDLKFPGYERRVRYRKTPADLDPYLETWDRSFRSIGVEAEEMGGGFLRLEGPEDTDFIEASDPKITVPVAALIGPNCSSATFSFARRAKESGLVRLFGEESGGNYKGINGSAYFFVRLPASGIEFDVPVIGFFPTFEAPDRGVIPDVIVAQSAHDIAAGADPCLDAALCWCRTNAA